MCALKAMLLCCLESFIIFYHIPAQPAGSPVTARYAGMAGTGAAIPDCGSGSLNQAGLAHVQDLTFCLHGENHFMLAETFIKAFEMDIPVSGGTFAISYSHSGYAKYFESQAGLAYGMSFGDHLSAGIRISHLMTGQPAGYGNMHAVVPEGGILLRPLENMTIGFYLFNPARQHYFQGSDLIIPSVMQIGIGYQIADQVLLCAEAEKTTGEKEVWKAGLEYGMTRCLILRFGVSSAEIARFSMGLGSTFRKYSFDFALSYHRWLGFSSYITLTRTLCRQNRSAVRNR